MDDSLALKHLDIKVQQLTKDFKQSQEEVKLYKDKFEQSMQAYDRLLFAFKQSQRRVFGPRSERFLDNTPGQGDFFSMIAPTAPLSDEDDHDDDPPPHPSNKKQRKKQRKKKKAFAKNLPRREVIIPVEGKTDDERVMRYETTELLNYIPPVYEVIVQKREVIVRKDSANLISIITAPNPRRFLPQAKVTEPFLAHIIVSKLYDRQPLYHLEKKFKERFDFVCPRNKLARWSIHSAKLLQPLVNLMRDEVLDYDIAGCDPTSFQVLDEPGRKPERKSYMYSIRGGPPERQVRLFEYNAQAHKDFLQDWFAGYSGYLQVDGQNIFESLQATIQLVLCHSHARRKFEPIAKAAKRSGLAAQAMKYYSALYGVERQATEDKLTPEQRYALRQHESKPIMREMFTWMHTVAPSTLSRSPLGLAFTYALKREAGLTLCLDDGRLELDTNFVEQQNKDFALARNNFLFAYSVDGAHALCVHMSLIFTAIAHGLDPYHYYVHIMTKIPHCNTVDDYERLLPWRVKLLHAEQTLRKAA